MKSQSAMEYLTTYAWAILIIAVVLVSLFALGIFNSGSREPKAQPGSCSVVRNIYGGAQLSGACTNNIPEFVAQFNGQTADIKLPASARPFSAFTTSFWINPSSWSNDQYPGIFGGEGLGATSGGIVATLDGANIYFEVQNGAISDQLLIPVSNLPIGSWSFVAFEWNGYAGANAINVYINGVLIGSQSGLTGPIAWGPQQPLFYIANADDGRFFQGNMADFQVYNTSLSANGIETLYLEGIGGTPIDLRNLVGWWPLNGNANDYSGNGNNGVENSISYSANWYSSYTAP